MLNLFEAFRFPRTVAFHQELQLFLLIFFKKVSRTYLLNVLLHHLAEFLDDPTGSPKKLIGLASDILLLAITRKAFHLFEFVTVIATKRVLCYILYFRYSLFVLIV